MGRGIRLCLEEPFFPHSWVGRGRSLIAKELWERPPEQKQDGKIAAVREVAPNPIPLRDPSSAG